MNTDIEIKLHGIYVISDKLDVFLVELSINDSPFNVDLLSFTQEDDTLPRDSWQTAYDEHYLNEDGTKVVWSPFKYGHLTDSKTRIAFFMYFIDFNKPLLTQYGKIELCEPSPMPDRLSKIISFEPID